MHHVQHGVDTGDRGYAYGPWGQSGINVGIVRAVHVEQVVIDSLQGKVLEGKLDGRVGLKGHTLRIFGVAEHETVVVHAGNHRLFTIVGCLLIDDARQCSYLNGRKFQRLSFLHPCVIPEFLVLFLHALKQVVDGGVPINIVGVGDEQGCNGCGVISQLSAGSLISEDLYDTGAVYHQFLAQGSSHILHGPYAGHYELQWFLHAILEMTEDDIGAH